MKSVATRVRFVTALIVFVFALSSLGSVSATLSPTYGTVVAKNSSATDASMVFLSTFGTDWTVAQALHWFDDGGGGVPTTTSSWYLDLNGDNLVSVNDVRVFTEASVGGGPGTKVKTGDTDINRALQQGGTFDLCYVNSQDGSAVSNGGAAANKLLRPANNRLNPATPTSPASVAEPVYIHSGSACGAIATGDIRVTAVPSFAGSYSAGTRVAVSDTDRQDNTTRSVAGDHAAARFRYYDADNSAAYSAEDGVYLDIAGNGRVDPGDIRFSAYSGVTSGTLAAINDADVFYSLTSIAAAHLAFHDADGSGGGVPNCSSSSLQDTLILRTTAGGIVIANDLRLTARTQAPTYTAGTKVQTGQNDVGVAVTDVTVRFYDANNDGRFDFGDNLYVDLGTANTVDAGDIRIDAGNSAGTFGTCVVAGNSDANLPLTNLPAGSGWFYMDADNSGTYSLLDLIYFATQPLGFVNLGDYRMQSIWTGAGQHGSRVGDANADSTMFLRSNTFLTHTPALNPTVRFLDDNGDGSYNSGEPVYLSMKNQATVQPGDVRLSGASGKAAGTQVSGTDNDNGQTTVTTGLNAAIMYVESGVSSGGFDKDDFVYLRMKAGTSVAIGDIRILGGSHGSPGSKVANGDGDLSNSLQALPVAFNAANFHYLKAEKATTSSFSAFYTVGDLVVYDTDGNNNITIGDIHLTGSGGVTDSSTGGTGGGGGGGGGGGTPSTNPTVTFSFTVDHDARLATFIASGSPASGRTISTYSWNFGDGTTGTGSQRSHTYAEDGTYSVTVTVTDNQGSTGTSTRQVLIGPEPVTPPDPDPDPTPDPTPDPDTDPTPDPTPDSGDDDETEGTPGVSMIMTISALAAAMFVAVRRRE